MVKITIENSFRLKSHVLEPQNLQNLQKPYVSPKALIFMHGVGANGANLLDIAKYYQQYICGDNVVIFLPNAPFPYDMMPDQGDCYQWFSLMDRSPKNILSGAKKAEAILEEYIKEIRQKYGLSYQDIALFGFSQGTMLALHYALNKNEGEKIGAVLGYSGRLMVQAFNSQPPICLIHGQDDDIVPHACLAEAQEFLQQNNFDAEFHTRANLMHSIDMEGIEIGAKFLANKFFNKIRQDKIK